MSHGEYLVYFWVTAGVYLALLVGGVFVLVMGKGVWRVVGTLVAVLGILVSFVVFLGAYGNHMLTQEQSCLDRGGDPYSVIDRHVVCVDENGKVLQ